MTGTWAALLLGYLSDWVIGEPNNPWHPVRLIARLAVGLEKLTRKLCGRRLRLAGALTWIVTAGVTFGIAAGILWAASLHWISRLLIGGGMVYLCIAPRGLSQEARRVLKLLDAGDLPAARKQLSMIVGRDTEALSADEVRLAVIETVAENISDGVVAPLLYTALGGPALGMLYKAVNTMDSMFGYRNERYREFGWAPARMDDLWNLVPARLSAFLVILAAPLCGLSLRGAARIWARDRYRHLSPNSAHPEAAFAGALGIRMGGAHTYGGMLVEKPTIGEDQNPPDRACLLRSLRLLAAATALCVALCTAIAFGIWR